MRGLKPANSPVIVDKITNLNMSILDAFICIVKMFTVCVLFQAEVVSMTISG